MEPNTADTEFNIFPINEGLRKEIQTYSAKFKCIAKEDMKIWGDYNSERAMQLAVKFHMCEGHDYCRDKEDILKWLSGKYIVLLYN